MLPLKAAALLLGYCYGKPKEQVTIEGDMTAKVIYVPEKQTPKEWKDSHSSEPA